MPKTFLYLCTATALSLLLLPSSAQIDPRSNKAGTGKVFVGNDQMRKALPGYNVLGGGPKNVDPFFTNRKNQQQKAGTIINAQLSVLKRDADKAYMEAQEFQKKGKLVDAGLAFRKSLTIREENFAAVDREIPVVKQRLAEVWLAMGKQDEAVDMFKDSMAAYAKFYGPGSDHRVKPLMLLGNVYMGKSDYKGAIDCFNQAYMLTQRAQGANSADAMKLRLQLAACNRAAKSLDLAASLYNECFDLQKKNEKLIDREQLLSALQDYSIVLKDLKKDDEAQAITARITEIKAQAAPPVAVEAAEAPPQAAKTTPESK